MKNIDEIRALMDPITPQLVASYQAAVGSWADLILREPALAHPLRPTTRANFIHDHVGYEVTTRVEGIDGVIATDALDFFALHVQGELLARFKFVGHGFPSNVSTEQQRMLAHQSYDDDMIKALNDGGIFSLPELITVAYDLDGQELSRVSIRRDCKGHPPLSYDIFGGVQVAAPVPLPGMEQLATPAAIKSATKTKKKSSENE